MKLIPFEIWRDIPGYEGYQASTLGNIRSLNYNHTGKTKNLALLLVANYYYVNIKGNYLRVNRLVYSAFWGDIKLGYEINHIDEDTLNDSLSNLNQMRHKDNCNYGTRNKRISDARKTQFRIVQQIDSNGQVVGEYNGILDVQTKLGYHNTCISKCCLGLRKKAYGYYWQYKKG